MANTDAYTSKASNHFRMEASKLMLAPDDGTYNLIRVPRYAFVTDVWIEIVTAFTGDASVTVGWLGNGETAITDGFIDNEVADPTNVGVKRGFNVSTKIFPGKYFSTAPGAITATVADNYSGTVKDFRVFAQFVVIHP
jgi:hypothetical protein